MQYIGSWTVFEIHEIRFTGEANHRNITRFKTANSGIEKTSGHNSKIR